MNSDSFLLSFDGMPNDKEIWKSHASEPKEKTADNL